MRTVLLTLAFIFSLSSAFAQEGGITITITIDNATSDNGMILASVHTADTFMKGAGVFNASSEIKEGKATLVFENVPQGTYAIMALHDANANKRMDFEANGMPKESYGMSGNDMSFGPPSFEAAKFEVHDQDLEFNIRF